MRIAEEERRGRLEKTFCYHVSPSEQRVTSMEGETMVVLVEILNPGRPTREHWGQCHGVWVEITIDG
jgi:hypothetical protein